MDANNRAMYTTTYQMGTGRVQRRTALHPVEHPSPDCTCLNMGNYYMGSVSPYTAGAEPAENNKLSCRM